MRRQISLQRGGANDARLLAVVTTRRGEKGRRYRLPSDADHEGVQGAREALVDLREKFDLPSEPIPQKERHRAVGSQLPLYGFKTWSDLFTDRQLLALGTLCQLAQEVYPEIVESVKDQKLAVAILTNLSLLINKLADMNTSLCVWQTHANIPAHLFGRKAFPMVMDFAEAVPVGESSGSLVSGWERSERILREYSYLELASGTSGLADATSVPLPNTAFDIFFTDPPYYDSVPYADLSDFFYVWMKRILKPISPNMFGSDLTDKSHEATVNHPNSEVEKNRYTQILKQAWTEAKRITKNDG
ncbi:MAG: hypothetical protein FJ045_06375, partial [Crenarchaeota archaeon]|nr:hypothetical protein [Thermoproteota archaeon]